MKDKKVLKTVQKVGLVIIILGLFGFFGSMLMAALGLFAEVMESISLLIVSAFVLVIGFVLWHM